jgi:hypothetical protein
MTTYSIVQIGSLKTGWAIEIDGIVRISYSSPLYLGARLEAMLKGAGDGDAALIAKAISARPWPDLEERLKHHTDTGPWKPALDPFKV